MATYLHRPFIQNDSQCIEIYSSVVAGTTFRLRSLTASTQLFAFNNVTDDEIKIVSYNGSAYAVGAAYSFDLGNGRIVRTSDTGNTFAILKSGLVSLYSVNASTLEITETLSPTSANSGDLIDMCFVDDDELLYAYANLTFELGVDVWRFNYKKLTITGGGTGFTLGTVATTTYSGAAFSTIDQLRLKKVDQGRAVALLRHGLLASWTAIFVDVTGAIPTFGSAIAIDTGTVTVDDMDESPNGCIFNYHRFFSPSLTAYYLHFLTYNVVGTRLGVGTAAIGVSLNSDTLGVILYKGPVEIGTLTVSGTTITAQTAASADPTSSILGNNSSTSTRFGTTATITQGCLLT